VVITIIVIVSAVALPTVLPALSHRQVSEAARILQGALVGARDSAIHNNAPSGIRLLPDPTLNGRNLTTGALDPGQILASNRIIPIEPAPEYTEGRVNVFPTTAANAPLQNNGWPPPYPGALGGIYPIHYPPLPSANVLMVEESVVDPVTGVANSPTSWFWNIRVGDKIQIGNSGPWYTVVGPMNVGPLAGNPELFVNVGVAGTRPPLQRGNHFPEFLFLVNGRDDNGNGWVDEGWDGVNNNANTDKNGNPIIDELAEWEAERWLGAIGTTGVQNETYTIRRRPAPSPNAREVALPSDVVIDLTSWGTTLERSRVPAGAFNTHSGSVDLLVNPDGTVVPTTIYSSPSSFGMAGAFFHFWLAERGDLAAPTQLVAGQPLSLPIGTIDQSLYTAGASQTPPQVYSGPTLRGEYRIVTLFSRTGAVMTNDNAVFDNPAFPADQNTKHYNPGYPYLKAQQGVQGGSQ
jgi:hypothetical protein